ncbi:GIY-YIG nuclease family protein [Agaribacterium haliotis]|uniref:GIY-YIG nuclease family protein n=1 Tax=Agaribacterium haliotis TaxID=2013869 RepID=UPI000BB5791E|nr:GIY-YIG nuclease family protein [Agaribacterium haliotis]
MSSWYVYLLRCADDSLYCGVTTELQRRVKEHNFSNKGARYTRARRPVSLAYSEKVSSRQQACRREAEIKKLSRKQKLKLINPADS